jgi:hypothetical protein
LENRKKATIESPRSVLKRKTKVKEGGAFGLRVKREQDNTEARAQKMMKGKVAPFEVVIVV